MRSFLAILLFFSFSITELSDTLTCLFDMPECVVCDIDAQDEQDEKDEQKESEKKEMKEDKYFHHHQPMDSLIFFEQSLQKITTSHDANYPVGVTLIHTPPPENAC